MCVCIYICVTHIFVYVYIRLKNQMSDNLKHTLVGSLSCPGTGVKLGVSLKKKTCTGPATHATLVW